MKSSKARFSTPVKGVGLVSNAVVMFLHYYRGKYFHVTEISNELKTSLSVTARSLSLLKKQGLVNSDRTKGWYYDGDL